MTKRIAAIVFIFACTSIAWFILGATIWYRTDSVEEAFDWVVLQLAEKALGQPGATL